MQFLRLPLNKGAITIKPNQIVAVIFVCEVVLAIVYELWAVGWMGEEWTVTYVIREWSAEFPILPLAVGLLMGHLFFCQHVISHKVQAVLIEKEMPGKVPMDQPIIKP